MKKYLMTGIAALTLAGTFTSCSHDMDLYSGGDTSKKITENYENAFVQTFGQPAPTQDWGFGSTTVAGTRGFTRANAVVSGDPFTFEDTSGYYIVTIDENQYSNLSTISNLDQGSDTEWVVTANFPKLNFYGGHHTFYIKGDVTMPSDAYMYDATFYVLKGSTLTLNKTANYNTVIYVADGGTLNYNVDKLERNPQGGEKKNAIYNHGTVNLANDFKLSNGSLFYNEGIINGTNITSAPADGDPSFFYNFGNVELSGKHQLNSCASFFNEGTFTVAGETELTQGNSQIWLINKGIYTTGNFKTAAWNATMYNYCSMFVTGDALMQNGQFYQMNNSYLEANRGVFNNFQFVMADGSGVNIKSGSLWGRDGADFRGKYDWPHQGFVAIDDNAKVWVRLGGENRILDHKGSAFHVEGANMTFGYENVKFYSTHYWWGGEWDNTIDKFADESTAESLAAAKSENTTWDLHNVTKVYTGNDFKEVTATPKAPACGATWTPNDGPQPITETRRIIAEDLTLNDYGKDFDFNDVVFDVNWTHIEGNDDKNTQSVSIKIYAAGGELTMYVGGTAESLDGVKTVNDLFQISNPKKTISKTEMINTIKGHRNDYEPATYDLDNSWWSGTKIGEVAKSIHIRVIKSGEVIELSADQGKAASKIAVGTDYVWCDEREDIDAKFGGRFSEYVGGAHSWNTWYNVE